MQCTYCKLEIPDDSIKCAHCQEYINGDICTQCKSTIPKGAFICKYCNFKTSTESAKSIQSIKMPHLFLKGSRIPSVLFRFRLLPHEVNTDDDKITIHTPGIFRLWCNSDEIPWNKIAGFRYRNGIIWDKIEIETRGQKPSTIIGLSKTNGSRIRKALQSLEL